jgi:hypothetical protein
MRGVWAVKDDGGSRSRSRPRTGRGRGNPMTLRNCEEPNFSFDPTGTEGAALVPVR